MAVQLKLNFSFIMRFVFGAGALIAVLVFGGLLPSPQKDKNAIVGSVTLWGDLPATEFNALLRDFEIKEHVNYVEKIGATFDRDLVEALASGHGPDIILLPQELILRHRDKITPIPYESFTQREFQDTFIEEGELYLDSRGVLAFPFSIDPLVMYWNRSTLTSASVARPPVYWDELLLLAPRLTQKTSDNRILKSAVALGEMQNVAHAKDIISMLSLQIGNPIISFGTTDGTATLSGNQTLNIPNIDSVLRFYTGFSDPVKGIYSWNRSLSPSQDAFVAQDLALYFGYASEKTALGKKNPTLNFDVAVVPQVRDAHFRATFGKMKALAIMNVSRDKGNAFNAVRTLTSREFQQAYSAISNLPPVRRDLLSQVPVDAFGAVFYDSALISRGWYDPDPAQTNRIFLDGVENSVSGRLRIEQVIDRMNNELNLLIR